MIIGRRRLQFIDALLLAAMVGATTWQSSLMNQLGAGSIALFGWNRFQQTSSGFTGRSVVCELATSWSCVTEGAGAMAADARRSCRS